MKIFKSFKTLLHICRTAPWPIMFKNMMCLFNKSLEDFLGLGFLGVINFNFLPLFNSLDKNCEFLKPYCTSIGQSLPYHKRWHSYCINCKWSSGNYLIFFWQRKLVSYCSPPSPMIKQNLITDHVTPKHILVNHLASAKNVEDFLNLIL